jgi:2-polyprenyl-3-methyl-5-hydroxy-6-metoxy-1,4-benzoquinol methylase
MSTTLNYYQSNASSLALRYESAKVDHVHTLLQTTFSPSDNLLEIGCGSGRDASFLHALGYTITAIDASQQMIDQAKLLHPELFGSLHVRHLPDDLDFSDTRFDGVYSIATLMHLELPEIKMTLKKIFYFLMPQGKLLFSVSVQRDDIDKHQKDTHGRHFTTIPKEEWINLCENIGFHSIVVHSNTDGLNREGIVWLTCIMEK